MGVLLRQRLEELFGSPVRELRPLAGPVSEVLLADGRHLAVKQDLAENPQLHVEAQMLAALAATGTVPVPQVHHAEPALLCLAFVETDATPIDETQAAEQLAALHAIGSPTYGFDVDTLLAGLPQPNGRMPSWQTFFRDRRLLPMAQRAFAARQIRAHTYARIQLFSEKIHRWLPRPQKPGLVHGDLRPGNVLARGGRIAALVDPAVYYADPEIELAFVALFGTFGDAFFRRYAELRPLSPDFFEVRKDVYALYPLLAHACLSGGAFPQQVEAILDRLGA